MWILLVMKSFFLTHLQITYFPENALTSLTVGCLSFLLQGNRASEPLTAIFYSTTIVKLRIHSHTVIVCSTIPKGKVIQAAFWYNLSRNKYCVVSCDCLLRVLRPRRANFHVTNPRRYFHFLCMKICCVRRWY